MNKDNLKQNLCLKFCSYYNPSKNEPVSCRAFSLIEGLFKNRKKLNFDLAVNELTVRDRNLVSVICSKCPFYENDCDFAGYVQNAKPCGGYIFIKESVDAGIISLDDIR